MKLLSLFLFALAAPALAAPALSIRRDGPVPPNRTFIFSVNLTLATNINIGNTAFGQRVIVPILTGAFAGPRLAGTVTIGLVTSLIGNGTHTAEATYVLHTNDGANIVVTERVIIPLVEATFETGSEKYAWLNKVTAWADGTENNRHVALNFWQLTSG